MKINNLNVIERVQGIVRPPEENLIGFYLSNQDVQALNGLVSRWNLYGKADPYAETIRKAIDERHSLKEVTLSKTGRHSNQGTVWLEKSVRKALIKEAIKEGIDPADYIRGIIYSLNQKLLHEEMEERERVNQLMHDNRKIPVKLILDKELREKLLKRFDKELMNEELREKVKRRPARMNGTTVEDRMLQEVLNNHLLKYLNK
ncbi:hypothetical protein EGH10_04665 [Brevibacillus laterosporus]|uniref:Uncharacterized protein n=1 Tax=Brevibacillus laterosporus LMG 15441 TaxID=1042163 RepID=A0A075RB17_BRELA|nr:hypothetical protein [Brevibacillus laterosporus]AIG28423.1 hypothetical protein BRLA_c041480 [Brevibacillus laterosporus LMG 15441]RJL13496.1 hypothetical protein DM460_05760 [Brevibacillus laterosporus]TPH16881.1 hypothetical protein EGH10_04665 [Brevibacillus laterosporus]HAS01505.1 hypothetical protein [Brevibacillus sp.]